MSELDAKSFRRALGNFATGVTVVTATAPDGTQVGVTANSFNSVSLDPALILWSIDKRSGSYQVFEQASHFAVNILANDQIDLSNHFARPSDDKFSSITYSEGAGKAAILPNTSACFECEKFTIYEGGDHWILVGKVISFTDSGRAPLVYHQGGYAAVMPHSRFFKETQNEEPAVTKLKNRFNSHYFYQMVQATRAYQANYSPLQLSSGLRTSEARMLMVLQESPPHLSKSQLQKEINMPESEIDIAAEVLQSKGLINVDADVYSITTAGTENAESLWQLAMQQQDKIFAEFSEEELATFSKILCKLAAK